MSLDFYFDKIENYKEICYVDTGHGKKQISAKTRDMIFATMIAGINELKDKETCQRFLNRLNLVWAVNYGTVFEYTLEEIEEYIGLRTNATELTKSKFLKQKTEYINL